MADYKRLKSSGVEFTPEDVIRLNALALKVKLSPATFGIAHLPRAVFLPGMVLREPTIGHEMWLERVGGFVDFRNPRAFRIFYSFALSRPARKLPDPLKNPKKVLRKAYGWAMGKVALLTDAQLKDALDYVLFGDDWRVGEFAPAGKDTPAMIPDSHSATVGVISGALACRIPLSLDDAKKMTSSQVLAIVNQADLKDGNIDFDGRKQKALGDYYRALEEVGKRSRKEGAPI